MTSKSLPLFLLCGIFINPAFLQAKILPKACFSSNSQITEFQGICKLHTIQDVFKDGTFEIERSSGFRAANSGDCEILRSWKEKGQRIRIWPNSSWMASSDYEYVIENSATQEKIEASLTRAPFIDKYNHHIAALDVKKGQLTIQYEKVINGLPFLCTDKYQISNSWSDQALLAKMYPGDIIIEGDNYTGLFFKSDYDFILINIALPDPVRYVSAKLISSKQNAKNIAQGN